MVVPVFGTITEFFSVLQLVGFTILFLGVVFYNEILTIPFLGFNKYTQRAIAAREHSEVKVERTSLSLHH